MAWLFFFFFCFQTFRKCQSISGVSTELVLLFSDLKILVVIKTSLRRWEFSRVLSAHPRKCALFALWRLVFPEIKCFNSWSSSKHPFTVVITQFVMVNCTAVEYNDALELSFQSRCLLSFKMYLTYLFKLITTMFTGLRTAKVFSSLSWTSDQTK